MTTKQDLMKIRSRALRTRVWFKALSRVERAIIDLTIKCVEKVRSPTLESVLSVIVCKILESLENRFLSKVKKVGRQLAENLANIAQKWGNKDASSWKYDKELIIFLGINSVNGES